MANLSDPSIMQQQKTQAADAARQAQKAAKPADAKPSVQFSDVLKNQQRNGGNATITMLKNNPVAGAQVLKNAVNSNKPSGSSKLVTSGTANAASSTSSGTGGVSAASTTTTSGTGSTAGSGTSTVMDQSYKLMEMNQDFNLQYLNLQENMQAESRQYTALSNVSKTKTDTAKNSLSNVK